MTAPTFLLTPVHPWTCPGCYALHGPCASWCPIATGVESGARMRVDDFSDFDGAWLEEDGI